MPEYGYFGIPTSTHSPAHTPFPQGQHIHAPQEEQPGIIISGWGHDSFNVSGNTIPVEQSRAYTPGLLGLDEQPNYAMMANRQAHSFPNSPEHFDFDLLSASQHVYSKSNPTTPPPMIPTIVEPHFEDDIAPPHVIADIQKAYGFPQTSTSNAMLKPPSTAQPKQRQRRADMITPEEYRLAQKTLPSGEHLAPLEVRIKILKAFGFPIGAPLNVARYIKPPTTSNAAPSASHIRTAQEHNMRVFKHRKPAAPPTPVYNQQLTHRFAQQFQPDGTLQLNTSVFNVQGDQHMHFYQNLQA